jgi:hypothetical protein
VENGEGNHLAKLKLIIVMLTRICEEWRVKYCWYFKSELSLILDEKIDVEHFISEDP